MAGKRQHILPKFLLKGFASRIAGDKVYAWVYRKDGKIFETNIDNIAVEKLFYEGTEGESADTEITNLEGDFALLLDELRTSQEYQKIYDPRIASLITHLAIRTKHLRESLRESTESMTLKMKEHLSGLKNLEELTSGNPRISPMQKKKLQSTINYLLDNFKISVPDMIKDSQIKMLQKNPIPKPRVEDYRNLHWFIYKTEVTLVLGDVGCVFETSGDKRFTSLASTKDGLKNIFLPISKNQILIGSSLSYVPSFDCELINKKTVKLSREFFIYPKKSSKSAELITSIGEESEIISKEKLNNIIRKSRSKHIDK